MKRMYFTFFRRKLLFWRDNKEFVIKCGRFWCKNGAPLFSERCGYSKPFLRIRNVRFFMDPPKYPF